MKQKFMKLPALALMAVLILTPQTALADKKDDPLTRKEKIQLYQATKPEYQFDTDAEANMPDKQSVRFLEEDGIYRNPDAEITNEATLMITGDLMCQWRQQEAAFTGSGKKYIGHEEMLQIKEEALAKQEAAKEEILLSRPVPPEAEDSMESGSGEADEIAAVPSVPATSSMSIPSLDFGTVPQPEGSWDFDESFRYVRKILKKGDLVIGNLETMLSQSSPLTMQCRRLDDKPYLNSPVEFLDAVNYAGYDLLTLANNHNCDTGVQGLLETLRNIDNYGFMRTGMFAGEEEDRYLIVDVNGIKIGFVAYATYFNTKEDNFTAEGQEVLLNKFDIDKARSDIKAAKKAGAEFIIAFMHWGKENTHETTSKQQRYARYAARAGADYIVGSHPHALQPYDIIQLSNGREIPVIYSMGNFLSCMQQDINNDTLILQLDLKKDDSGQVFVDSHRFYPCTIMPDLEITGSDGTVRTDSYVVTPHLEEYMPILAGKSSSSKEDLAYMDASLERILPVYESEIILPLPYDPYGLQNDDDRFSGSYIVNRIKWLWENRPV